LIFFFKVFNSNSDFRLHGNNKHKNNMGFKLLLMGQPVTNEEAKEKLDSQDQ